MELKQSFKWHSEKGLFVFGREGYFVIESRDSSGVVCSRMLKEAVKSGNSLLELQLRVVVGKRYGIRLCDGEKSVFELIIKEDGWIVFLCKDKEIETGCFLTWFRGLPVVDPSFLIMDKETPGYKTVESDEHVFGFQQFDFENGVITFNFDDKTKKIFEAMNGAVAKIDKVEIVIYPTEVMGKYLRVKRFAHYREDCLLEEENFPVYWEPIGGVSEGFPDDNTHSAANYPSDYKWLKCSGRYCWIKGHLPQRITAKTWELCFDIKTTDVEKETCMEMHADNGTMADAMLPVKVGILHKKFFSGFASIVYSEKLKKYFWKGQHATFSEIEPQADTVYSIRIVCSADGYYSWWVNDIPMQFSGVAKTGTVSSFPGLKTPGYKIPYYNEKIKGEFPGFSTIALHYGTLTEPGDLVSYFGNFTLKEVHSSV